MRIIQYCILLLFVLLLSCSSKETEKIDMMRLHDIWALESIDGEKVVIDESIKNLPKIEIYVEEERVYGNTSCNSFNGKAEMDENHISFSKIIATEIACPNDLEQRFLSAIDKVDNYKFGKMRLFLLEGEVERMVFRKID
ncbi:MAG: META domain-containing protein [Ignavibacteriaceae bacterium]|nr:META domain-containing protein [Ignavibacteria bacterium]NNL22535.1 META domain-containing protein [Ignavibacteriaceae bacterium]